MATGIEMLGQMGTDQSLAGPVQGGNMVVKPNQVPVGGAAMLSKALRRQADKGVGGMYVLPEQKDQTPEFMKIAQSNVMRDIEGQRNQYPNNYSEAEGGIIPMLPRNLKTAPGADETTLAYITPEEQAILGLLNPGTPHRGPEDIPTYDSVDYDESGNVYVTTGEQASAIESGASPSDVGMSQAHQDAYEGSALGPGQAWSINPETGKPTGIVQGNIGTPTETTTTEETQTSTEINNQQNEVKKAEKELEEIKKTGTEAEISAAQKVVNKAKSIFEKLSSSVKDKLKFDDSEETTKDKKRIEELLKEAGGDPYSLPGSKRRELEKLKLKTGPMPSSIKVMLAGAGAIGDAFSKPKTKQFYDDNYLNILEEEILPGYGKNREEALKAFANEYDDIIPASSVRPGDKSLSPYESLKQRLDNKAGIESGSDLEKRLKPVDYYRNNQPQTSGGLEGMVQNLTFADIENSGLTKVEQRRLGAKLMEARDITSRQRDRQDMMSGGGQRPGTMGGGAGPVIEDEVIESVVEEGATTMPYTGPRTGGAEVNVPLSRRFALDPTQQVAQYKTAPRSTEDIYKYFTEGTTGEGLSLEPYGEFQKRRRKALGKKPLDFWSY